MNQIRIKIFPSGLTEITVNGCVGPSCTDLTATYEHALGAVIQQQPTEEFYAVTTNSQLSEQAN